MNGSSYFPVFFVALVSLFCQAASVHAADPKKPDAKGATAQTESAPPPYDRICQVDVHYIYRPKLAAGEEEDDEVSMTKVFFATISEQGMIAEDIQKRLNTKLGAVRAEAMKICRAEHQEQDACVARKLAALSAEYPKFDYLRRKMLFESIRTDCGNSLGTCLATESSETKCWMNVPPEIVVPNEPKVEIAQPGKAEPDIHADDVADLGAEETEEEDTSEENVAAPSSNDNTTKPAETPKKKRKKKKKPEEEEAPAEAAPTPAEGNPYAQPFTP